MKNTIKINISQLSNREPLIESLSLLEDSHGDEFLTSPSQEKINDQEFGILSVIFKNPNKCEKNLKIIEQILDGIREGAVKDKKI